MNYVFETSSSSQVSEGLGGSFNSSNGTITITNVEVGTMIMINVYINISTTSESPSYYSSTGLSSVSNRYTSYNSEGVTYYTGVFIATATTAKLVFSYGTSVTKYGYSACQLSI